MSAGFVVAATTTLDTPYWGRVVISMVLMATGLALSVSPATEAIMGALPESQAGAGSAVNDTVREVGGTLGVAVVGSTLSTVYGPRVVDGLSALHVHGSGLSTASDSIVGGIRVATALPGPAAAQAVHVVQQSFMDGVVAGSLVSAGRLPARRDRRPAVPAGPRRDAVGRADSGSRPAARAEQARRLTAH